MTEPPPAPALNAWTVAAIAIVAYCTANLLHEGLGHGGACILVGCKPQTLNAVFFDGDAAALSTNAQRFICAGGSLINLLFGGAALALLRARRSLPDSARYFLWLFAAVNLLMAFGYLLFSGLLGVGDWTCVIEGLVPHVLFRIGLAALGGVLYFMVAPRLLMPLLFELVSGSNANERERSARRLSLFPYLVGGATFVAAGLLNPRGIKLVLISAAAASFGGTSLLGWYPAMAARKSTANRRVGIIVRPSIPWLCAGAIVLIVFVGILGPGINLKR